MKDETGNGDRSQEREEPRKEEHQPGDVERQAGMRQIDEEMEEALETERNMARDPLVLDDEWIERIPAERPRPNHRDQEQEQGRANES